MTYSVFLPLEPYLAQWLHHESGGQGTIRIKRGSSEADIVEFYLKKRPKDIPVQIFPKEGEVEIILPFFKSKDVRIFNYLSDRAKLCLHACIRNRFRVQLWKDLHTVGNVTKRTDISIREWMREHGIQYDDRNWNTIAKMLQRMRAIYSPDGHLKTTNCRKSKKNE